MEHPTWEQLRGHIDKVIARYGGTVHDSRCNRTWDAGQAACAAAYGPDWNDSPEFAADNALSTDDRVPDGALAAAKRLADGECDWAS